MSKHEAEEYEKQINLLNNKIRNMVEYQNNLESKENIYQDVLDSVPAFIFWKDKNNNMLGFNSAYQKAVNISREELLSKTGFELFPDAEKYWIDDLEVINSGIPKLNIVEEVIIPPNKTIWFKTDKTPLNDINGNRIGVIGVSIDITELQNTQKELNRTNENLVKTQKELQELNEDLDRKVKLRTRELQEVNENLKRVNLDLDNFIYIASHDLKHPVLNMKGILEQLNKGGHAEAQKDQLMDYLNLSVNKMIETINELANLARVQNNIDEEIEEINLQGIYEEVMFSLSDMVKEYPSIDYQLDFNYCPDLRFSRKNLRSIFYNMISNAIKYQSPERKSYMQISCRKKEDYFILDFRDNGIGIKEEHLSQIFEMYKRFHDNVSGSGLGLYIVKRITANYGGDVNVSSEPGVGSHFIVKLPADL